MFGFSIRTRQNVTGSPKATDSPQSASSPRNAETPKSINSPKMEVGEIDTRAPFQSVKAAVSLFGEGASPKGKPLLKKPKTVEERVLEKETQLHLTLKELNKFKEQLKCAETTKAEAERELGKANRTLQELTCKLETASESKQAAIAETEAAKIRAKQLEEEAKSGKAQPDTNSWKLDVDSEREHYKASAGELIVVKQELTNIRQDFDAALEIKLAANQEAADAQHSTKVNAERLNVLSKEFETMRETLSQVKLATTQAREEQAKITADKEALLQSHKTTKEEVETKILSLKEEESELELYGNLEEKLEETMEGISVLQEQLKTVRESDFMSLRNVTMELEDAKITLQAVLQEESLLRNAIDSLKMELNEVKAELLQLKEKEAQSESIADNLRIELETSKAELEATITEESKQRHDFDDMLSIIQLSSETENARQEVEETKRSTDDMKQEAENAENETKLIEEKLQVALKEAEEAKAAAKLASDLIHSTGSSIDATNSDSREKIKLSVDDFEFLSRKVEELENLAQMKVVAAMAEVEASNTREIEAIKRLEASWKEIEHIKAATEDALRKAEMAGAAKQAVEGELQKWRQQEQEKKEVGEPSS